jgi:hypothetical protein
VGLNQEYVLALDAPKSFSQLCNVFLAVDFPHLRVSNEMKKSVKIIFATLVLVGVSVLLAMFSTVPSAVTAELEVRSTHKGV